MTEKPPQRISSWLKIAFMLAFLFLASLAILRSTSLPHEHVIEHAERKSFPNLTLVDEQGFKTSIERFRGKVVLVSFWASWCMPCLEELPAFGRLSSKYGDDFAIVAINQDTDADVKPAIDELWRKHRLPFKTFYDPGHELAKKVDLEVLPTNFVLDRQGRLSFSSHGVFNWEGEHARQLIEELLAEKS